MALATDAHGGSHVGDAGVGRGGGGDRAIAPIGYELPEASKNASDLLAA